MPIPTLWCLACDTEPSAIGQSSELSACIQHDFGKSNTAMSFKVCLPSQPPKTTIQSCRTQVECPEAAAWYAGSSLRRLL